LIDWLQLHTELTMQIRHSMFWSLLLLSGLLATEETTQGADRPRPEQLAKAIAPFLDRQALVVVHANLDRFDGEAFATHFRTLLHEGQDFGWSQVIEWHRALREVECDNLYLVVSLADLPQPPFLLFPSKTTVSANVIREKLAALLRPSSLIVEELFGMTFVGRRQSLERLRDLTPDVRASLVDGFEAAGESDLQAVFLPTADDRRVIEELLPTLPDEIGGGPSTIVTRGIRWGAIGVKTQSPLSVRIVAQSQDDAAAIALRDCWQKLLGWMTGSPSGGGANVELDQMGALASPTIAGNRVVLSLSVEDNSLQTLSGFLTGPLETSRMKAFAKQSMNNLKMLALSWHNFHDTQHHFPAVGTYDAAGRPLLSWRVQLLPFVDLALYKQFRLDEPWDSEHNRKLIPKMPEVFRSPPSKHRRAEGLATYQVVVGEHTAFPERAEITYKQFTDGVSRTILFVEVDDAHATIWTKPEGLPYDAENPAAGFGGQFKGICHTALCDGSALAMRMPIDPEELKRLLIRDDRKPVD
jgi:hypothetical protein